MEDIDLDGLLQKVIDELKNNLRPSACWRTIISPARPGGYRANYYIDTDIEDLIICISQTTPHKLWISVFSYKGEANINNEMLIESTTDEIAKIISLLDTHFRDLYMKENW